MWVKAEPQDIVEEAAAPSSDFDFDLPPASPGSADESFLSADEEKLLDSFDSDFEVPKEGPSSEPDLSTLPSIDEMPTIETSLLDEAPSPKSDEIEDLGSATIDISLEDIDSLHSVSTIRPDSEIDMSSVQGLDSDSVAPSPEMEDVSTEFLDDTSSAKPSASQAEDVTAEFLDAEPAPAPAAEPSSEFESLDIDLHFDDTLPQGEGAPASSSLPGFEEVTEFDDFLAKDEAAPAAEESQSFDDLAAVERDLSEPAAPAQAAPARPAAPSSSDLSTEILLKIAEELSSIRGELVSLKTQLGDLRREAEAGSGPEEPPPVAESESRAGGFFDEEEDETIALTGDELDNILNTADFTEESVESEAPADIASPEQSLPDTSILPESILPESGDYGAAPADLPAIEEISLAADGTVETLAAEPPSAGEVPELGEIGLLAEEGVTPMTAAPEDTSYLESEKAESAAETLVEEPSSSGFGDLGMENVPLVEPDLSDFETEELEAEPLAEIEEELPLVDEAEPLEADITLQSVPEAEPIEAAAEPDHSHFTGIDLHEEDQATPLPETEELVEVEEIPEIDESSLFESAGLSAPMEPEKAEEPLPLAEELSFEEAAPEAETLVEEAPVIEETSPAAPKAAPEAKPLDDSERLKTEIRSVLSYLDKLLDSLPEDKIEEFARSEHFDTYKRLFEELGLV